MIDRPVVLLTFANQRDAYLDNLKEESSKLNNLLSGQHDKNAIEVYREESATVDTIARALQRFNKRIIIYHYAGHADGDRLYFEDGGGDASGIAGQLGLLPNLQLVFLNGCSTMSQVKRLLDLGIKAVIATAVPINDHKAVEFAEQFYGALSQNNNIQNSFRFATEALKTRYGGTFSANIVRKNEVPSFEDVQNMPWALYVNDTGEEALNWQMPTVFTTTVTRPPDVKYEVNDFMLQIWDAIIIENPKIQAALQMREGDEVDPREKMAAIIEFMPWPIGVQIRLLSIRDGVMDTASVDRLSQIVSTYIMTVEFAFYTVLSQVWDERRNRYFPVFGYLADVARLDARRYSYFDFFKGFMDGIRAMKENNIQSYVSEYSELETDFSDSSSELYGAYLYLESLRSKINNGETADIEANIHKYCADGEYFLATLLVYMAFLVKYDLITIRDIQVVNPKHLSTRFNHFIGRLNAKIADIAVSRTPRPRSFDMYAHNASVVLTKDAQNLSNFLNLSPFIIDRNAFGSTMTEGATEQQLFVYAYQEGEDFRYFATQHNVYKVKERPSDQLVTSQNTEEQDQENSRRRIRIGRTPLRNAEDMPPNPFAALKEQFKLLEKDLLS